MKKIASVSKRALAVLMAAMVLFSFSAVTSFAALSFTLSADHDSAAIIVKATGGDGYSYEISPAGTFTQDGNNFKFTTPNAGTFTVTATLGEETDTKILKTVEKTIKAEVDHDDKSITAKVNDSTVSPEIAAQWKFFAYGASSSGNLLYNLTPGNSYKVIGYYFDETSYTLYYGTITSVRLKQRAAAPTNIKATAGVDEITVEAISGAEYKLINAKTGDIESDWDMKNTFTGLEPNTHYTVYARIKATETYLESNEISITLKTLETNTAKVADVEFTDVQMTSLTVKANSDYEYSLDGKTWQTSNKFTGLTKGKDYTVSQRIASYSEGEHIYAPSEAKSKSITTNNAETYNASMTNVKGLTWKDENHIRAGKENEFTVHGDIRNDGNIQWGDTRIVPTKATVKNPKDTKNETEIEFDKATTLNGSDFKKTYNPESTGEKTFTVTYEKQKYMGGDHWEEIETVEQTYKITVLRNDEDGWGMLVRIINFLTDQLPSLLLKAMQWLSDKGLSFMLFI